MKRVAFVTSSVSPDVAPDDMLLLKALKTRGIGALPVPWDDSKVSWTAFDLVLIRSCWNYHLHADKFDSWVTSIKSSSVHMLNSPKTVLWNVNKNYLSDLANKGVTVPDSVWISAGVFYPEKLQDVLIERRWRRGVLKPCVSAGSFRTNMITTDNAIEQGENLIRNFPAGGMIFQEFIDEIPDRGELSIIFFNGEYSHAVLKQAAEGEFRVQHQFGGTARSVEPARRTVEAAENIISKLDELPLYARVDGFVADGEFTLMELELIEPVLFLGCNIHAAGKLASHISHLL